MKCLEIARLQDFAPNTQGLLGALSRPQTPCRIERTPSENVCLVSAYGPVTCTSKIVLRVHIRPQYCGIPLPPPLPHPHTL